MRTLDLGALLQSLVEKGTRHIAQLEAEQPPSPDTLVPTTIRLTPQTHRFCKVHADALNISTQAFIAQILEGVMETTQHPRATTVTLIRDRFLALFEAHGIPLTTIPAILGDYGVTLSALRNDDRLLDLINDPLIDYLATTFHVTRRWLTGQSTHMTATDYHVRWYKSPELLCQRVADLHQSGARVQVHFVKSGGSDLAAASKEDKDSSRSGGPRPPDRTVCLVLDIAHRTSDNVNYHTYERWEAQPWNYWRSRFYLKALILFCDRAQEQYKLQYTGTQLDDDEFTALITGTILPATVIGRVRAGRMWYPEDFLCSDSPKAEEIDELPTFLEWRQEECNLDKYLAPSFWLGDDARRYLHRPFAFSSRGGGMIFHGAAAATAEAAARAAEVEESIQQEERARAAAPVAPVAPAARNRDPNELP